MLLGAGIFYELLCDKRCILGKHMPVLHETKLGWIFTKNNGLSLDYRKFMKEYETLIHMSKTKYR